MTFDAYAIAPPVSAWDDKAAIYPAALLMTAALTPAQAWARWTGGKPDNSMQIQMLHDRGYRVVKLSVSVNTEE